VSNRFDTDPGAGGTEVLTADLAAALAQRSVTVTWLATSTPGIDAQLPPFRPAAGTGRKIRVAAQDVAAPPVDWQERERAAAREIIAALGGVPSFDLVHVTHFSRTGLGFLDHGPIRYTPVVATLTDYTAVCGDFQMIHGSTGRRCTPPVPAETCATCLAASSESHASAHDIEAWRQRNLAVLNQRCRALWVQTPQQRRHLAAAGLRENHIVSDRAAYAIPPTWRSRQPAAEPLTLLFLGRASAEKGLHILLDAFMAWPRPARLRVFSSPDDAGYERLSRRKASGDPRIEWRRPVARDDLVQPLNGAHALIVPSQWDENHPMVLQYALALGLPVLCSSVASLAHLAGQPGLRFVDRYWDTTAWVEAFEDFANRPLAARTDRGDELRRDYENFVDDVVVRYRCVVGAQ
jgi:glycosyltransferase involved in cell wall biosynthesis